MGMDRDTDHLPDMKPGENINDWMDRAFPDDKATETDDDPRTRRLRIPSAILLMASFAATILVGVLFASHAAPAWQRAAAFIDAILNIAYWKTDRRIGTIAGRRW